MAILYDQFNNPVRSLQAVGGDSLIDARTTANLAALNAEVVIDVAQEKSASIDVRGTLSLTLVFEVTFDGTNYTQFPIFNPVTELYVAGITAAGSFVVDVPAGARRMRVRCSAFTSGIAAVMFRATNAQAFVYTKPIPRSTVTNTGASGAAVTLTIPAAGAGLFNYLDGVYITKFAAALLTAAAAPVLVTTTGLIGTPTFSFSASADAQGTVEKTQLDASGPMKGTAANTAMTFVAPVTTGVIWRMTAAFYTGA